MRIALCVHLRTGYASHRLTVNLVIALTDQWIDAFRAGDYSDKDKGVFTDQDIQQIVDNYDPAHHEAPVTVGHAKQDTPAFAWVSAVRRVGDLLQLKVKDVYPAFAEALQAKLYKKRSVGLVKGDKGWALHHLAFLGGMAPEVKGLKDMKFATADDKAIEIDFSEETEMADDTQIENALTRFFAKFAPKPAEPGVALTAAQKVFSEAEVKEFAAAAAKEAVKEIETRLTAQTTEFSEFKKREQNAGFKAKADAAVAKLKAEGKWIPAFGAMGVPEIFEELAKSTETVEFGEADKTTGAKPKVAPLDVAVKFFEGLKKIVPTDPIFSATQTPTTQATAVTGVNETAAAKADPNSTELTRLARVHMDEKGVSYEKALEVVVRQHPHLTRPGGATAGAA